MKQVIVVTGAAQGIGRIAAESFIAGGCSVAVWENDNEALIEQKEFWKDHPDWLGISCDISDEKQVADAVGKTVSCFGRIDVLINNAAIHANRPIQELSVSDWRRVIDVNLTGPFICAKYCSGELIKSKGSIINISSTRAFQSEPNTEAYSASKGGLISLTHALAISLGPHVRVNSVSPGWIDVSSVKKQSAIKKEHLTAEDHLQHPSGRVGNANDIVNIIKFLVHPENNFITGQNFFVDGGMTKKMIYV